MPAAERGNYIFRISRMMQERAREFAVIESMDGGKAIRESRDVDVPLAANHFFYYAGWADKLEYAFPGRIPRSLGVAGQIIPWNFPLLMAAWKIAPAIATGNTVVLKPAETTPLTALKLAELRPARRNPFSETALEVRSVVKWIGEGGVKRFRADSNAHQLARTTDTGRSGKSMIPSRRGRVGPKPRRFQGTRTGPLGASFTGLTVMVIVAGVVSVS